MIRRFLIWALAIAGGSAAPVCGGQGEAVVYQDTMYWVHRFNPNKERLELVWKDRAGRPYKQFEAVRLALQNADKRLRFITNAGIYERGPKPLGLHVEEFETLVALNRNVVAEGEQGWGNFYMRPGGVFYIDDRGAAVMEIEEYHKGQIEPRIAVQSGPLLVDRGVIHPKFNRGSKSRRFRNGVGVDNKGRVVFAICQDREVVNFHNFATLFRDRLRCRSALFLDGDVCKMLVNPEHGIHLPINTDLAAMFVVTEEILPE